MMCQDVASDWQAGTPGGAETALSSGSYMSLRILSLPSAHTAISFNIFYCLKDK